MIRLLLPLLIVTNVFAQNTRIPMPQEDDAELRLRWEQERLMDPATGRIPRGIRQEELEFATQLPRLSSSNTVSRSISPIDARGPWNFGGRSRAIALDVNDENIILAGSVNGGVWRSTDGGTSWVRVSPRNQNPAVTDLFQDKRTGHTNEWYYTTGEGYGASAGGSGAYYLGNGIYRSTNGGITWSVINSTSTGTPHTFDSVWDLQWRVAVDPADTTQTVIYAATYGAIMRSPNGGTSWSVDLGTTSGTSSYFTELAINSQGVVYATLSNDGPSGGLWRKDRLTGWANITPFSLDTVAFERLVMGINPSNENRFHFH
ncbi:MAG: WD40/YVTN/BNR-like repeat-containing protein [Bacteroidota bacterium]